MNIVVQALGHDDFAAEIAERRPTLYEFVQLVEAGALPRFSPELLSIVGLDAGARVLANQQLAYQAQFVVLAAQPWLRGIGGLRRRARPKRGSWLYARQIGGAVVLVPDDDEPTQRLALFAPQPVGQLQPATLLRVASVNPTTGAVDALPKPCEHGYVEDDDVMKAVCHNHGCAGECQVESEIEEQEHTVHCACR